jgi:hypothetical protein
VLVPPVEERVPHGRFEKLRSRFRIGRRLEGWRRLWIAPVLEAVTRRCPHLLVPGFPDWVDDQPGLQLSYRLTRSFRYRPPSFAPPLPDAVPVRGLGPGGPEGLVYLCM